MENKIYNYNGTDITFLSGNGDVMVNATEMAKPFGKLVADWTRQKSTNEFISSLSSVKGIPISALVQVVKGGTSEQGTWMHEDVAMEFARWLSPTFAIWCNDRIKELLKYGMTATQPTLEAIVNNPDLVIGLAQKLKEEREHKAKLQAENDKLRPKAELMDKVMDTDQKIDVGQAAKILQLPFGRNTLFQKLREKGVFFSNRNEPKQEYIKRGYFDMKEKWIERDNHDGFMVVKVLVTQKGLDFIAKLFEVVKPTKQLAKIM